MVTNRITGMISGLDTEQLVKQMMALSQSRYDTIRNKKVETEWRKQLYDDIYKELDNLDKKLFDASLSNFNNPKKASISNDAIATVTASSNASNVTHTLKVLELARSASMTSDGPITTGTGKSNLNEQIGLTTTPSDPAQFTLKNKNGSVTISVDASDSISSIVSQINNAKDEKGKSLGLKATYDANTDRLFINSTEMGVDGNFTITAGDGTNPADLNDAYLLTALNLNQNLGQDAEIELNGVTFKQSSNDFTIAGLNFSLKATTGTSQTVTIGVRSDSTKLVENVKSIVESYNKLLEMISGRTSEKVFRDYGPLSDEQKKEMSEKEIELWEEKAKSGLLRNDTILSSLATRMRTAMYDSYKGIVDGKFDILSSIGISTTNYKDRGKLTVDEDRLTKALEEDPDAVSKLFSGPNGVMSKVREQIKNAMTQMADKGGAGRVVDTESSWAKQLRRYNDQLDVMAKKMKAEENRYYLQFASLEKTLSNMNNSSSYMLSMFNGQ